MKISILLPYKENFSPNYPGAVSIHVKDTSLCSKYKKDITIYGSTNFTKKLLKNYVNLEFTKKLFQSGNNIYLKKFIEIEKKKKSDLIEVHNRPSYIKSLFDKTSSKLILYFHNDPINMLGSKSSVERLALIDKTEKIVFNSEWSKNRFLFNLDKFYYKSKKLIVINQSTSVAKIDLSQKKKIITFVGKLNKAKGYDIFGNAIIKILNKYSDWTSVVIGDEPREKISFHHKNLEILGFQSHKKVLNMFKKSSISVACSRWDEPFGRASLEAASRGCAVIISDKGGLPETVTNSIILKKLNVNNVYKSIEQIILDKKFRIRLQKKSLKNFYLSNKFISKKIDNYRDAIIESKSINNLKLVTNKKYKIIHITNFNERHDGRLFYNTGRRINNGFVRLNHSVLTLSDRDIVSYSRSFRDINGSLTLNRKLIKIISNYTPDIIVMGHADLINRATLNFIKKNYPFIKICQWFLDRMDSEWKNNKSRFLDKIDLLDCSFCTTSPDILKFPKINKVFYLPNPSDISFEKLSIYENKYFQNDVFFAMSHGVHRGTLKKGKFDKRETFIKNLMEKIPNIKFDLYGLNGKQPIWADDFHKQIQKSKMAINLSQGDPIKFYTSDRISQLIGNGILTFIDKKTQLDKFFKKDEIIFYKNINDLAKKIIKYSDNDKLRIKIAKKAKQKYLKHFNSTAIADYILKKSFNIKYKNKFYWEK